MNLLVIGPQGSGKGTQAARLSDAHGIPHVSTGEMFRAAIAAGTELGLRVEPILAAGQLVPDDLTVDLIRERLAEPDAERGFVLDGFPRNLAQAEALDAMLDGKGLKLDAVLELKVDQDKLVGRIVRRAEEARAAGQPVRKDDDPEVFKTRLEAYNRDTAVVAPYYEKRGQLTAIDGMQPIDSVSEVIANALSVAAQG